MKFDKPLLFALFQLSIDIPFHFIDLQTNKTSEAEKKQGRTKDQIDK
jgi:hypothetical protein